VLADENCRALSSLGLTVLPVENDDLWRNAAKIKAQHPMSLADAFAVTTAQAYKTKLVVGSDRELGEQTKTCYEYENEIIRRYDKNKFLNLYDKSSCMASLKFETN